MDHGACNVIYLDRRAREELVRRDTISMSLAAVANNANDTQGYFRLGNPQAREVHSNIETILSTFNEVHVCHSGTQCLAKLTDLHAKSDNAPTVVLIDVPYEEEQRLKRMSREPRSPSPTMTRRSANTSTSETSDIDDLYGVHLLTHIAAEVHSHVLSKLVVPVVVLSGFDPGVATPGLPSPALQGSQILTDTVRLVRYLDAGATDVLSSPLSKDQVHGLAVHAYRAYKDHLREEQSFLGAAHSQGRKMSWVGVNEAKPYAYLREAMVSGLMGGICNPESIGEVIDPSEVEISPDRHAIVAQAVGTWSFSAHDFTDDELLHGALLMLQHALKLPELERWRISTDDLKIFLIASRTAYNDFVLYHNFRHVSDVLQAVFYFLVRIGTLPPYPEGSAQQKEQQTPVATLLKPFDALTLLISAIGHDVGHPGVNNAFLVALNSPLAQLYNDRSVLESFHCAAYSQILRRYWPVAFSDVVMRKLMINSILATDMGLHFKYMSDLGNLQEKLAHNNNTLDGWSLKVLEEYKDLTCGLLIKCADISNVARKFDVASRWASILTDEFLNQGAMEKELNMPTCLFGGPPVRDNVIKMGESQIGFMNIFARPLFQNVTEILPAMRFSVDELNNNKTVWEKKIEIAKEKANRKLGGLEHLRGLLQHDAVPSPMSNSQVDLTDIKGVQHSASDPTPVAPSSAMKQPRSPASPPPRFINSFNHSSTDSPATPSSPAIDTTSPETPYYPAPESQQQDPISTSSSPDKRSKKETNRRSSRLRSLSPRKRNKAGPPEETNDLAAHNLTTMDGGLAPFGPNPNNPHARARQSEPVISPPPSLGYPHNPPLTQQSSNGSGGGGSGEGNGYASAEEAEGEGADATRADASEEGKGSFLTKVASNSSANEQTVKNRPSRFGLTRIWRKRWRGGERDELNSGAP